MITIIIKEDYKEKLNYEFQSYDINLSSLLKVAKFPIQDK